jgi:hypothetical protein
MAPHREHAHEAPGVVAGQWRLVAPRRRRPARGAGGGRGGGRVGEGLDAGQGGGGGERGGDEDWDGSGAEQARAEEEEGVGLFCFWMVVLVFGWARGC